MEEGLRGYIEHFLKNAKRPLITILGETASGKTALSLEIANLYNGEVISADSRQVYREMDIATDKIKDQQGIPHHLIDIIDPNEPFTLADYQQAAIQTIEDILRRKKIPLLVGGTALYINAITQNYQIPLVPPDSDFRNALYEEAQEKPGNHLHEKLKKIDPQAAAKIHPHNLRYIVRALEINLKTEQRKREKKGEELFDNLFLGIRWPRHLLYERIHKRVDQQMQRGLLEETEKLLQKYSKTLPSMTSLGYREMIEFLEGKITYTQAIELIKKNTCNFSKRQSTWFKKNEKIFWLDGLRN